MRYWAACYMQNILYGPPGWRSAEKRRRYRAAQLDLTQGDATPPLVYEPPAPDYRTLTAYDKARLAQADALDLAYGKAARRVRIPPALCLHGGLRGGASGKWKRNRFINQ